jgi:hypothetical protein
LPSAVDEPKAWSATALRMFRPTRYHEPRSVPFVDRGWFQVRLGTALGRLARRSSWVRESVSVPESTAESRPTIRQPHKVGIALNQGDLHCLSCQRPPHLPGVAVYSELSVVNARHAADRQMKEQQWKISSV